MSEKRQSNSPITERVERATILGLVRCAASNQVQELEWKNEAGRKIHVRLKPRGFFDGDDTSAQSLPVTAYLEPVFAPKCGLFERVKGEAAASDGQFVKKGQLLGFILIDLLLQPVRAPFDGIVNLLGHKQGDRIASGELLFKIATTRESSP